MPDNAKYQGRAKRPVERLVSWHLTAKGDDMKRYDLEFTCDEGGELCMEQSDNGDWVAYEDHEKQLGEMLLKATSANAVIQMAASRLGACHTGNLLQRIDILREQERCLAELLDSVSEKATEICYAAPDDAFDLSDIMRRCRAALDAIAS